MNKKKIIRKSVRPLNIYSFGGDFISGLGLDKIKESFSAKSLGKAVGSAGLGAIGNIGGALLSGKKSTGVGSAVGSLAGAVGAVNPLLGGALSLGSGLINAAFGSELNQEKINEIEASNNALNALQLKASDKNTLMNKWGSQDFGNTFSKSDVGSDGWFSNTAEDKYNELLKEQQAARNRALSVFDTAIKNNDFNTDLNAMANYSALGGKLNKNNMYALGGNFSNGVTTIDEGGAHEENPNSGVQMGLDAEGTPNLVEEGETIFNDYVFSNRLSADSKLLKQFNLPTSFNNNSFAKIAEKLNKESYERPNDPISKRGLMSSMIRLQQAQEILKNKEEMKKTKNNMFELGGLPTKLNVKGLNPKDLKINTPTIETLDIEDPNNNLANLRYAPVFQAGMGVLSDLFGLTNTPDHSNSNMINRGLNNIQDVSYTPVSNYLKYTPLDKDFYINKLNSLAGSTRRGIVNQSAGNRGNAVAGLLASDFNAQTQLGNLARQTEEYNQGLKERVETFNRNTNMFNSEMGLKADYMNQQNNELLLKGLMTQSQMRENTDRFASMNKNMNMSNLFDSLGDIGKEEFTKNMVATDYTTDSSGKTIYKPKQNLEYTISKKMKEHATKNKTGRKFLTIGG